MKVKINTAHKLGKAATSETTFNILIEYHEGMAKRVGAVQVFQLEGFENVLNICNYYHFNNAGIKFMQVRAAKTPIYRCKYSNNQYTPIKVKKPAFSQFVKF